MSEIKHTPGPWQFDEGHCSAFPMLCLYAADNMNPFHGTRSDEEQNANARLIAAAPELLDIASETRIAAAAYLEDHPHVAPHDCYATGPKTGNDYHDLVRCPGCQADASFRALIAKIDAAIAKATGSQS